MVLIFEPPSEFLVLLVSRDACQSAAIRKNLAGLPVSLQTIEDLEKGMRLIEKRHPQMVLVDAHSLASDAMRFVSRASSLDRRIEVVILTQEYSPSQAMEAIQAGAADVIAQTASPHALRARVKSSMEADERKHRIGELDAELLSSFSFQGMVGRSPRLLELFNKVIRVAPHFGTVLVSGASGTGKELVARALHDLSPASKGPFVVCNCAALPESLAESQLFGFQKGSFTGALSDSSGFFERAHHGTIFLDEIGEMPLPMQAKLLRVLQTHEIQRLGSPETKRLDIRVVAASNRDLRGEVTERRFREDLYYRLSSVHLHLPALAERMEDLPMLQRHFLQKFSEQYGKPIVGITRSAQDLLAQKRWPGNVRELENTIAGACLMCEGQVLDVGDFPVSFQIGKNVPEDPALMPLKDAQRKYVLSVLKTVNGNKARAAEILKISRSTLYSILAGEEIPETG